MCCSRMTLSHSFKLPHLRDERLTIGHYLLFSTIYTSCIWCIKPRIYPPLYLNWYSYKVPLVMSSQLDITTNDSPSQLLLITKSSTSVFSFKTMGTASLSTDSQWSMFNTVNTNYGINESYATNDLYTQLPHFTHFHPTLPHFVCLCSTTAHLILGCCVNSSNHRWMQYCAPPALDLYIFRLANASDIFFQESTVISTNTSVGHKICG
jgi:hypothetical protein